MMLSTDTIRQGLRDASLTQGGSTILRSNFGAVTVSMFVSEVEDWLSRQNVVQADRDEALRAILAVEAENEQMRDEHKAERDAENAWMRRYENADDDPRGY